MRIACLQFNPQLGDITANMKRAEAVIARAEPSDLDLLILPELAFSGYNYKSLQEIGFHLEPTAAGTSTAWARAMATRFKCFVCVGYPEYSATAPGSPQISMSRYNSAVLVDPQGNVVVNYRKHFLFSTDETWAEEGKDGFYAGNIADLGKVAMGICMDLNPYKFVVPFHEYEFANHVIKSKAELVILPMAWLTSQPAATLIENAQVPDADTLAYWVQRMQPLIDYGADHGKEVFIVISNRIGSERESNYAGTSVILGISKGNVRVYGCLGRGTEDLLVADIPQLPSFKPKKDKINTR